MYSTVVDEGQQPCHRRQDGEHGGHAVQLHGDGQGLRQVPDVGGIAALDTSVQTTSAVSMICMVSRNVSRPRRLGKGALPPDRSAGAVRSRESA